MNTPQPFSLRDPWVYTPLLTVLILFLVILLTGNNTAWFIALNGLSRYTGDDFWAYLTVLGDTVVALTVLLAFAGRKPGILWAGILAALLAGTWSQGLKAVFDTLRPAAVLPAEMLHIIGPALQKHSFPSGHTTAIFALAAVLCLQFRSIGWRGFFIGIAVLTGISRAAVGVHWPLDILAGAFGGWLSGAFGTALAARLPWGTRKPAQIILVVIFLGGALLLALRSDPIYAQTWEFQIALAVICIGVAAWGLWRQRRAPAAAGNE